MKDDRELMQQALEAMGTVGADWICEASHHAKKDQHKLGEPCPLQQRWHIAYQALRERLAQTEQSRAERMREAGYTRRPTLREIASKDEQPEQVKDMSWHHPDCQGECIACLIQRAVQDEYGIQGLNYLMRHVTTPPRREWVGLTDTDIEEVWADENLGRYATSYAIEAKLKEKNA